jgi:hypothetical protein
MLICQPTLTNNTRSRPRHEVGQAVSMVSALFQVERDRHDDDHYSHFPIRICLMYGYCKQIKLSIAIGII